MLTFSITAADHCRRTDSLLRQLLPLAPVSYRTRLVKSGHLLVNGQSVTVDTHLFLNDLVSLKESGRTREFMSAAPPLLDILYEDRWLVIINKPAGLPVHRAAEVDEWNLVEMGERFLSSSEQPVKLRPINRLDRGTSGVILLAKSATAAGMFGRTVKAGGLGKVYLAMVSGRPRPAGTITTPVDDKEAITSYRLLRQGQDFALLALFPQTGRLHQIRKHLRHIGHPVLGDLRYGGMPLPGRIGILLHSFLTELQHPATGEPLAIFAPLSADFLWGLTDLARTDLSELLHLLASLQPSIRE